MLGTLLFFGALGISGIKAAHDNYEMKKVSRKVDENGNIHYMDRYCHDYINGERVQRVESTDKNGVKLYSTVGVNSSKVYDTSYGRGTQQLFEISEQDKQRAIENGKLAYMQYNPYFGRQVTTEISTGRTITCLFEGKDSETNKPFYKKWYFRPECQDKYDWRNTVKGDYGIDISKEEYYKLKTVLSSYASIPRDQEVAWKLMNIK